MPAAGDRSALVGRDAELARVRALLAGVRDGRGAALRIEGAPGVGKTALLAAAAAAADVPCLAATGVETELELPLAGLEELLRPLPGPGALVLLVDDVQWLDPSSRTAVGYLARRAHRLGIGVVAVWSLRGAQPDDWPGVESLALGELHREAALRLAREGGLAGPVAEILVGAVGGNPLALVEAPGELSAAQRSGRAPLPDPMPVGEKLQRSYAARVALLPGATREALLRAAAGAPPALVAHALGPAEDAALVRLGADVAFTHPLVRSAVYHAAAPSARRAAHHAIAAAVEEPERSWQHALAAAAPDEALAARLAGLGEDARVRG